MMYIRCYNNNCTRCRQISKNRLAGACSQARALHMMRPNDTGNRIYNKDVNYTREEKKNKTRILSEFRAL